MINSYNLTITSLIQILIVLLLANLAFAEDEKMPSPPHIEVLSITNFIREDKKSKPSDFKINNFIFEGNDVPENIRKMSAQWMYTEEVICQGSVNFGDKVSSGNKDQLNNLPTWSMYCRSGWSAHGILKQTSQQGEYLGEGAGPDGKKVTFKLKR